MGARFMTIRTPILGRHAASNFRASHTYWLMSHNLNKESLIRDHLLIACRDKNLVTSSHFGEGPAAFKAMRPAWECRRELVLAADYLLKEDDQSSGGG